jgi:hypothetical protein
MERWLEIASGIAGGLEEVLKMQKLESGLEI